MIAALACALVVVPGASAAALSTVVDVGTTAGSITPATVTGSAGDTFQIRNLGSEQYGAIFVLDASGTASVSQWSCAPSAGCRVADGETATITILTPGTLTIERNSSVSGTTTIGTLTVAAPAAPAAAPVLPCDSSAWNFGVVDYTSGGYGDQILVTWTAPKICSGSVTAFTLHQATSATGSETAVDPALCTPALSPAAAAGTWSCALKVASITGNELFFRVTGTTSGGQSVTSRQVKWERDAAPNADVVKFGTGACGGGGTTNSMVPGGLVCFIISLVIQTEYASNGNQSLTDKQARELLNIGVAFADTQSTRQGRAAKTKWVSIGKKTIKIKKSGKLTTSLPISKRGRALLKKGPLKVRVTYTLTRGTNERRIVKFVTLPRIAS
jgi:hypothetical protein